MGIPRESLLLILKEQVFKRLYPPARVRIDGATYTRQERKSSGFQRLRCLQQEAVGDKDGRWERWEDDRKVKTPVADKKGNLSFI